MNITAAQLKALPLEERMTTINNLRPSPREQRLTIKTDPLTKARFRNTRLVWDDNSLRFRKRVGKLMPLIHSHYPQTYEEWQKVYLKHGRSLPQLRLLAVRFLYANTQLPSLTLQEAIDFICVRVLDETWWGHETELKALDLIRQTEEFTFVRTATPFEDYEYAVDILCYEGKRLVQAYQVKPDSYMMLSASHYAKKTNARKNDRFRSRYPFVPVHYIKESDIRSGTLRYIDPIDYSYTPRNRTVRQAA